MFKCPECGHIDTKVYLDVDALHHIIRVWCPLCKVWWSFKSSAGIPGQNKENIRINDYSPSRQPMRQKCKVFV